jgi:hypothetical protein
MASSIGNPIPDCGGRRQGARLRREALLTANGRGVGATMVNGEETAYGQTFGLNFHKGLPHDVRGFVHRDSYEEMVRSLSSAETGAAETLPIGANRGNGGAVSAENPPRYTIAPREPLRYRKLTSPFTGHVYEVEGADAGAFAISAAPLLDSQELAAEMAELYAMALVRDAGFSEIEAGTASGLNPIFAALQQLEWFDGSFKPRNGSERRRFQTRGVLSTTGNLFRGSTPGSKAGPWLSQYLLMGGAKSGIFVDNSGVPASPNPPGPNFRNTRAVFGREDGFVLFGTQIIDQRSIVAREGIDYMTNWAAWLDAQNGVDFGGFDVLRDRRRYLYSPRDVASYVHFDALYQAYLVACLLMLGDSMMFPTDRGLPETNSRTRQAFASFGGPHILSLVTEVATRALKAVWRQKWQHHRRARPEVVAALLTLNEHDPNAIEDETLRKAIGQLRGRIPDTILNAVAAHNTAQNAAAAIQPTSSLPGDFPVIADDSNFLLPMAFPEGSPTHPAYGAGHATVAGACVTVLKAFFEMYETDGAPRKWPYKDIFVSTKTPELEGGELVRWTGTEEITVEGELDKLAANVAIGRNMAGVHYYTDYYESLRLGERIAVSILEEQLSMYTEPVSMSFTSFDGDRLRITAIGDASTVHVSEPYGRRSNGLDWFSRYED